jgi:rhamnosyltransferase
MEVNLPVSQVIAIVPTFCPDPDVIERLNAVSSQVSEVIVVDDGSPSSFEPVLAVFEAAGHTVIRHGANRGIAAALNTGSRKALDDRAEYIVTIDQDTLVPPGYVDACLKVFDSVVSATNLGVVAVDRINDAPSIPPRRSPEGFGLVEEAIQSGMVISARCLGACGLFDERLFIDCVDTEFCLRVGDHGYRIAIAPGTQIAHTLGERAPLRPFGIRLASDGIMRTYEYHGPYRRYFIMRNNVDLWLRYRNTRRGWVLRSIKREFTPTMTTIGSGPQRFRQLLATLIGVAHGLRKVRGPMTKRVRMLLTGRA